MPPDEYIKAFDKAVADLAERVQRRDLLNAEIAGLKETVRVLQSRVTLTREKQQQVAQLLALLDYATPNLADSIRSLLLRVHPQELTAIEVRNALEESGFNFDDFSNPLSACHAALKRMQADGEIEIGTPKNGKTSYRQTLQFTPTPSPTPGFLELLIGMYEPKAERTEPRNPIIARTRPRTLPPLVPPVGSHTDKKK